MAQQTAVEYLFERLFDTPKDKFEWYAILEQVKQMEKEQIIDAYCDGFQQGSKGDRILSEEYYNEIYK